MKHLKPYSRHYNESIISGDIKENLQDICLELQDIGFIININKNDLMYPPLINAEHLIIHKPHHFDTFKWTNEISEIIERVRDYMNTCGFHSKVYVRINSTKMLRWTQEDSRLFIDLVTSAKKVPISHIKISFIKK